MKESKFKDNITTIINDIREASNKTVEFILIGGAQTNEDAVQFGKGTNYYSQLNEIANEYEGVIAVDVGRFTKCYFKIKTMQILQQIISTTQMIIYIEFMQWF